MEDCSIKKQNISLDDLLSQLGCVLDSSPGKEVRVIYGRGDSATAQKVRAVIAKTYPSLRVTMSNGRTLPRDEGCYSVYLPGINLIS